MANEDLTSLRSWYADEIGWASGVVEASILKAFARVPREDYLPPGPWLLSTAMTPEPFRKTSDADPHHLYHNVVVAIDPDRDLSSALPSYMALLLDLAHLQPGACVGHIGAGLGYYSAIMAELVGDSGSIIALELDPTLADLATRNLKDYSNVQCLCADGSSYTFLPRSLDALIISAGASIVQRCWLESLRQGGCLIVPLFLSESELGQVTRITRRGERFRVEFIMDTIVYPCIGSCDSDSGHLLREAVETFGWYSDAELRLDVENADQSAWIVTPSYWISMIEVDGDPTAQIAPNEIVAVR